MRRLDVVEDIVPLGQFKTHASELLRQLHSTHRPLVITKNGKAAAVVLTPEEFEDLGYREFVKAKVRAGVTSAARGPNLSPGEVRKRLKSKIRDRGA
jgi:prevent-host-death family protein